MSEQTNSQYLFMTDEQIAEHKRKQAEMHARLIAAFPEPKSDKQRIAELEAQLAATEKERDEWKDSAINGGNAGYLREQLAELKKQEPVCYINGWYGGRVVVEMPNPRVMYPMGMALYAAPVVPPDMVMVPRAPTDAMIDAAMNRYQHVSPEAKARYTQMHRENFRCDYKAMIAAAEKDQA